MHSLAGTRNDISARRIKLMGSALDEVTIILPEMRTAAMKAKLASRILAAAAKGERDPNKLRIAALLEEMDV